MSVSEVAVCPVLRWQERMLCGWGRVAPTRARVIRAQSAGDAAQALEAGLGTSGGLIARGAGRSYGDAAQNAGGWVLDMNALRRVTDVDEGEGLVRAQAGATVARVLRHLAARGETLAVIPGTRHATIGGAIAADVHGKNHHHDGSLAGHLASLTLCTPAGETLQVTPEQELFAATVGGMGLTGVIVEATLRTRPLPSPWLRCDTDRTRDLQETLAIMGGDDAHRYSVAWIDLLARGRSLGRSVVTRGDHAEPSEVPAGRGDHGADVVERARASVPARVPGRLLSRGGLSALNVLRWRAAPRAERGRLVAMAAHFFPLDALGDWNRLYGPEGLVQYQFAVPRGQERVIHQVAERLGDRRLPAYLAVLKRLGPGWGGLLSFPLEGWTLAVDLPAGAHGLAATMDELDELIAGVGGRVYLAKDGRLHRDVLAAMYPGLPRLGAVRELVDPEGTLRSDLARRLGLSELPA